MWTFSAAVKPTLTAVRLSAISVGERIFVGFSLEVTRVGDLDVWAGVVLRIA
jgi:hypothetical protein